MPYIKQRTNLDRSFMPGLVFASFHAKHSIIFHLCVALCYIFLLFSSCKKYLQMFKKSFLMYYVKMYFIFQWPVFYFHLNTSFL